MKRKIFFLIYPVLLIGVLLFLASGCKKEDDDDDNNPANTFTDSRDLIVYKTVTIGNQVWMAENLKYLPGVVGSATGSETTPRYYVYGYDGTNLAEAKATANYSTYGVLYNWEAAKAACPTGWHLPSDAEWSELADYLGGVSVAGGKIKETGTTHWNSPNEGATDETGFTALPGGYLYGIEFLGIAEYGLWWSSTEYESVGVWYRSLSYSRSNLQKETYDKSFGLSVRCVKTN